jgi:haloacetate dehalogenase
MYDVLQTWQACSIQAQGKAMPTGHFLAEQMPKELTQEIMAFLKMPSAEEKTHGG